MRKLVVYITRVLNVKLAVSFYISVSMQYQCLIFYQHKQWIQITAISHLNAYKEVFWLKFQGGACPPDPLDCVHRWNRTAKYHDAFSFFWGKPCSF